MYIKNLRALDAKLTALIAKYEAGNIEPSKAIKALLPIEKALYSMVHNKMLCEHTRHSAEAMLNTVREMVQDFQDDNESGRILLDLAMLGWLIAVFIYTINQVV